MPRPAYAVLPLLLALSLTACGGGSSSSTSASATATPSAGPSGAPTGGPFGGGIDQAALSKIRKCLTAAGLQDAIPSNVPTGRPSGFPTDRPSGLPSGTLPSGFPSGGFGAFADPDVQAALQACGITLPSGGPLPSAGGTS
jgi:hypothetical protein